jgi:predicted NBD/HSP70 family sugar kinase
LASSQNPVIGGNAKVVRNINRAGILNLIRELQPISRISIAKITGLNKSTVSNIVKELITDQFVSEEMLADHNIGRNPLQLRLKLGAHCVGAINLDSVMSRVAIVDIDGTMLAKDEIETKTENPAEFVSRCIELLVNLQHKHGIANLSGIGVSVAGIVDAVNNIIINAPNLGWRAFDIGLVFTKYFEDDFPVFFQNDAKASALAELWFGNGEIKDISDFVFVTVSAGVGAGIVVGKTLLQGNSHAAGEFGHMIMYPEGAACGCGNRGCFEAYASDRATVLRYLDLKGEKKHNLLLKDVIYCAKNGDHLAIQAIKDTGYYLGLGISNIITSLDPQAVVIGGRITQMWDIIYPEILRAIDLHTLYDYKREIVILPSSLLERPRLLGAATLALEELFSDYKIVR